MYDVVVCGSAVIDVFVKTHCDTTVSHGKKQLMYPLGSKIIIEEKQVMIGGGGTNTSTSFARLGLRTAFLGTLGKDREGDLILDFLKKEKISFIGRRIVKEQTGYSIILDSQLEDRTLLTFKGANNHLVPARPPKARWLYSSSLVGPAFSSLTGIVRRAKRQGSLFAFNPSSYQAKMGIKKLKGILSLTDLLVCNKEEAQQLTGLRTAADARLARHILRHLAAGASLIITDGKRGASWHDGSTMVRVVPPRCRIVETTGAGDAFASTFLAVRILGKDVLFSLEAAMENAMSVISHYGAKHILLGRKALFARVKKTRTKIISSGA